MRADMGLRKLSSILIGFTALFSLGLGQSPLHAEPLTASSKIPPLPESRGSGPALGSEQVTPYTVVGEKKFSNYKVEIQQRMTVAKFPRVESMKVRIIPNEGGSVTTFTGTWVNFDPKAFVIDWQGKPLDLDGDGIEDLVLQNYSGGGHCCYNYVIYSLAKPLHKLGDLPMRDCGEKISFEDLNGDKKLELLSCNPDFIYLGDQPYSESPFPPAIYTLKNGQYRRADREFKQVFLDDIQEQREALSKAYRPANVLQIVADYLVLGEEATAWKEFDALYQGADKEKIRQQLLRLVSPR
ncbi:MAG TPA: hypothetical protein DF383_01200 [Deltaproteobacteria bacterium]|nr:hypothetical protein [Deltaproteobacteria bacterium]